MMRLPYAKAAPEAFRALLALQAHVEKSGLEPGLLHLVYLRVSQLNGCAYCVDMHSKDLAAMGESAARLNLLVVWREASSFSPRERAALAYAEALTKLAHDGVADDVYAQALGEFGDTLLVELTLAVSTINAWNRLSIAFRNEPGSYRARAHG
jgi:AhpD family alkylhydroperoxidase